MANKSNEISVLSDREHVLKRQSMYIGSIKPTSHEGWFYDGTKLNLKEYESVDGLLKIINEILDNSIDESIRTDFTHANKITVDINDTTVTISDNGRGIPTKLESKTQLPQAVVAFTKKQAGSNFNDDDGRTTMGMNGVGSFLTNCFSHKFEVTTINSTEKMVLKCSENSAKSSYKITKSNSAKTGTTVIFVPDIERFGMKKIDDLHKDLIYQRLYHLATVFPKITFTFNKKKVTSGSTKTYLKSFSDSFEFIENDHFIIAVTPNEYDDFKQFSCVNGLLISKGGNHINHIVKEVTTRVREKVLRRYKTIRVGDIKNKIQVICMFRNFPNIEVDSQTKESLTNSNSDIKEFLGDINWDAFCAKVYKNKTILDPIIENFKIKEELKRRKDLKSLSSTKSKTKIRNEKFLAPIKDWKYLSLCEGASAQSGLSAAIGREQIGYFELKGVPMQTWDGNVSKLLKNDEFSQIIEIQGLDLSKGELPEAKIWYTIDSPEGKITANKNDAIYLEGKWMDAEDAFVKYGGTDSKTMAKSRYKPNRLRVRKYHPQDNLNFENILLSTDADLDGTRIKGLLLTFFCKYVRGLVMNGKVKQLRTPMIVLQKGKEIKEFFFDFESYNEYITKNPNTRLHTCYKKGLGSWNKHELRELVTKFGLEYFIQTFEFTPDTIESIDAWMNKKRSDDRKEKLRSSSFSIFNV